MSRGGGQEIERLLPLHPERRANARGLSRQEQRPTGRLSKRRRERRGLVDRRQHQGFDLLRIGQKIPRIDRDFRLGKTERQSFLRPQAVDGIRVALAQALQHRGAPRHVDAPAVGRKHRDAPIAEFVEEAFDHDRAIARDDARRRALIRQIGDGVPGRRRVQPMLFTQDLFGRGRLFLRQRARELPDLLAEFGIASAALDPPERHAPRLARRRIDQHAIVGDLRHSPRRRAEDDDVALARLENHFFIQLADAHRLAGLGSGEEHAVEPAIRDDAAAQNRDPLRPRAPAHDARRAIPHDPRTKLGEVFARIAARQEIERRLECGARQIAVGRRTANETEEVVDLAFAGRRFGGDLLRQDVQGVPRAADGLDRAFLHGLRRGGAGQKIPPELREEDPARRRVRHVPRPPHALERRGDRRRRFDLDHQIDRPHVDPEFERTSGDERAELAALQPVFEIPPQIAREGAVMRERQDLARRFVHARRQPFRQPSAVDEEQRRAMPPHQFHQPRIDRRPDRTPRFRRDRGPALQLRQRLSQARHVFERRFDAEIQPLLPGGVDDRDRPRDPRALGRRDLAAAEQARRLFGRTNRGRKPDPLCGARRLPPPDFLQPFEREEEMRPALRSGEGVQFVDDDRVDVRQPFLRGGGQQQIERFRRRDEDVGGLAAEAGALGIRSIPRADRDRRPSERDAQALRRRGDARERRPQVALNVDPERFEGREIQHAKPSLRRRLGLEHQAIERGQERRQGLAGPGRRHDDRVSPARDRRPALRLRGRRRADRRGKPRAGRLAKKLQGVDVHVRPIVARAGDVP
jgi:hypothetical protein